MLKDLVSYLVGLGEQTSKVQYTPGISIAGELDDVLFIKEPGKELRQMTLPPKRRNACLATLSDLISLVQQFSKTSAPEFYIYSSKIKAYLDAERKDCVTMPFVQTARLNSLLKLRGGRKFTQKELLKFLRTELGGTGIDYVVNAFSKLDVTRYTGHRTEITTKTESLGRSVEAKVQGASELPDSFNVLASFYNNGAVTSEPKSVGVYVTIDMTVDAIELTLDEDDLNRSITSVFRDIQYAIVNDPGFNSTESTKTPAVFIGEQS